MLLLLTCDSLWGEWMCLFNATTKIGRNLTRLGTTACRPYKYLFHMGIERVTLGAEADRLVATQNCSCAHLTNGTESKIKLIT